MANTTNETYHFRCPNYAMGLAHLILCGASGWALHETSFEKSPFAFGTFAFLLGHGLLGILKHSHPETLKFVEKAYSFTSVLTSIGPISLINSQIYMDYKLPAEYIYSHPISSIIPIIGECLIPDSNDNLIDIIMLGNLCSLGYISVIKDNDWAMGLTSLTLLNQYVVRPIGNHYDIPQVYLKTVGLIFFTIFSVNCIKECK